jgi:hypothetical protein
LVTPTLGAASATSITVAAGAVGTPSITTTGDTNTGIFFPAADTIAFSEGGAESMRIDASGNVGIGTTSPSFTAGSNGVMISGLKPALRLSSTTTGAGSWEIYADSASAGGLGFYERQNNQTLMYIDEGGNVLVGKTASNIANAGVEFAGNGYTAISRTNEIPMSINRLGNDGVLLQFLQATTEEGTISVSGTTVSYNGGHLSRWAQMLTKPDLLKGTVMSNLDAMNVYTDAEGNPVANEQLNKVKVSNVEGDANVAGVFVNWTYDEAHQVDEINMAMTGDMIIRIAQGVTVQRGDLLMSAGDGTAKPQSDDIVRSKTIAKVTSNHVTCTYADGSYCVPCVLMAC